MFTTVDIDVYSHTITDLYHSDGDGPLWYSGSSTHSNFNPVDYEWNKNKTTSVRHTKKTVRISHQHLHQLIYESNGYDYFVAKSLLELDTENENRCQKLYEALTSVYN